MTTILHVVESYATGTLSALMRYVENTPELEHHVLRRLRPGEHVDDGEDLRFVSVADLPASNLRCPASVREAVRRLRPDVVHAHSSFAGLFVRVAIRAGRDVKVVYTPHCFAFERRDLGAAKRAAYRGVEWALAANTDVIAGCSSFEARVASRWRSCRKAVHVPNFAEIDAAPTMEVGRRGIVTSGRASAQKDPWFFAEVVDELRKLHPDLEATWIGTGTPEALARLEQSGVTVTGWLRRREALHLLEGGGVYVHTAAWEGMPMSLLEAAASGLPIVAREIPALVGAPAGALARDPGRLAGRVHDVLASVDEQRENKRKWAAFLSENSAPAQQTALRDVYGVAAEDVVRP